MCHRLLSVLRVQSCNEDLTLDPMTLYPMYLPRYVLPALREESKESGATLSQRLDGEMKPFQ